MPLLVVVRGRALIVLHQPVTGCHLPLERGMVPGERADSTLSSWRNNFFTPSEGCGQNAQHSLVFPNFSTNQNYPEDLSKHRLLGPNPRVFDLVDLG